MLEEKTNESKTEELNHLSAVILEKSYKQTMFHTVSRQQILSKLRSTKQQNFRKATVEQNIKTLDPKPIDKIQRNLYPARENTYTSLATNSYQSIHEQDQEDSKEKLYLLPSCPVLVSNLLATHADAGRHAEMTGCQDCQEYAAGLDRIAQLLQQREHLHFTPPIQVHTQSQHNNFTC